MGRWRSSPGKIIDEWQYRCDDKKLTVIVRYREDRSHDERMNVVSKYIFVAQCPEVHLHINNADVNALRKEVDEQIDALFAMDWKPFIVVSAEVRVPWNRDDDRRRSIEINYDILDRSAKKKSLWRDHDGRWIVAAPDVHGPEEDRGDRKVCSIIPWSEKSQQDVDNLLRAMDAMGTRILDALAPAAITVTLSAGNVLPPPKPKGQ